jgi:7,8-dihydropterin-6-yl-methyl-4-(beta-D-ribofuranosyl)aminobenzene 5'-phosphate synthase
MAINITTLSDNATGKTEILAEWGLSVLVECDGMTVLLDAGRSISATRNADALAIDLSKIGKIVLSHGHFDHTGGLRSLLSKMKREVEIIAHPDIWALKYSRGKDQRDKYVGIPYQQQELESLGARFTLATGPVKLSENILTTGEIPMVTDFEHIEPNLYVKTVSGWVADELRDDLALVIKSKMGLVVILGCAHRGMINTLFHARKVAGTNKVHMVLGGSHLKNATDEQIWQTISALNEIGVQKLGLTHCTGMRATLLFAQSYDKDFIFNSAGNIISLI